LSTLTREAPRPRAAPPSPKRPTSPRAPGRSGWRVPVVLALLLVPAAVVYLLTRPGSYHYRINFVDAGQLVTGDLVRIGGTPAGAIDGLRLTANGQAQVDVSIDSSYGPLRKGTTVRIRAQGLAGVASRYLDLTPAPTFDPPIRDGGVIPASQTHGIVDIDELFNTLGAETRTGLRRLIRGFAVWYRGESAQANLSAQYLPPALQAYAGLFSQIDADTPTLDEFLTQASAALGAIDQHPAQLTDLVTKARVTAQALGSDNQALSQALTNLPGALNRGSETFARLRRSTLPELAHLVHVTRPVTAPLAPFLRRLQPVLDEAVPSFTLLAEVFGRPGPTNDLYDALLELPPLSSAITRDFPRAISAVHKSTPVFEFARPYVPDLVAWVSNWDGIFAPYDANGHYARTVPVFDAFAFTDTAQGGVLTPKPPNLRGSGGQLRAGFVRRCPGGAIVPPPDHSAPFVDSGPLSNRHCRASETIGGTP
jgi:phospholipid/cholesterol/gamma-HCH transport system substrate-binding protein